MKGVKKKKKEDEAVDRMSEGPANDNVGLFFCFPLVIMFEGVIKRRRKKKRRKRKGCRERGEMVVATLHERAHTRKKKKQQDHLRVSFPLFLDRQKNRVV